jgi:hypothetical protein
MRYDADADTEWITAPFRHEIHNIGTYVFAKPGPKPKPKYGIRPEL